MERRNWSIKLLKELIYVDSLDSYEKANALVDWHNRYFKEDVFEKLDLDFNELKDLEELFYKNIIFLKEQQKEAGEEVKKIRKMKSFFKN